MIDLRDIRSLTDFQRNAREHIDRLRESGKPEALTVNGRPELVVMSAETYQKLAELVEHAETVIAVHEGLQSIERGEGTSIGEVVKSVRKRARKAA